MLKSAHPWSRDVPAVADSTLGWRFVNPLMPKEWTIPLGMTAEKVAKAYGITREEQDVFALASQQRAAAAQGDEESNKFVRIKEKWEIYSWENKQKLQQN